VTASSDRLAEFAGIWEDRYPAIVRLWQNAWAEFVPFLSFDHDIRNIVSTACDRVPQRPVPDRRLSAARR